MGLAQLKLNKTLQNAMQDAGMVQDREIQVKTLSRITGGQNIIAVAPGGSGKTTAYILGMLMRLKYSTDEAPKVLVLVKDQERGMKVAEQFRLLSGRRDLRIIELFGAGGMEAEVNELADGTDIVVSTPARARAVYLKLGLNMNRLQTLIIDDADELIAAGQQLPINELARSAGKIQYLVFATVLTKKLSEQIEPFMNFPTLIEVNEIPEKTIAVHRTDLYEVPNFQTKFNLLNHLLSMDQAEGKVVIYVNSRLTARNLYKEIDHQRPAILQPVDAVQFGLDTMEEFDSEPAIKILIVPHEVVSAPSKVAQLQIHVDIAENSEEVLRLIKQNGSPDQHVILMANDTEMIYVKKLENAVGAPFVAAELPDQLRAARPKVKSAKVTEDVSDSAYHKKKDSNSKTTNYGIGQKAVMNKKKKHS